MSELTPEDRQATTKLLAQVVRMLREPNLSLAELNRLHNEKEALLARIFDALPLATPDQETARARVEAQARFIERLMTRQGTLMPDFRSLYRRKVQLYRKRAFHLGSTQ